jgi:hypothetical protein
MGIATRSRRRRTRNGGSMSCRSTSLRARHCGHRDTHNFHRVHGSHSCKQLSVTRSGWCQGGSLTVRDHDDDPNRQASSGSTTNKPPACLASTTATTGISASTSRHAQATAEGRSDVLDARSTSSLVMVALGVCVHLGDRRYPVGLGDRCGCDGHAELFGRAGRSASAIRS